MDGNRELRATTATLSAVLHFVDRTELRRVRHFNPRTMSKVVGPLADFKLKRPAHRSDVVTDGSARRGVVVSSGGSPSDIAVDGMGGKICWTERSGGLIKRANLDETGEEVLLSGSVMEPVSVALDVSGGHVYWSDADPADFMISRANLDGTGLQLLVTGLTSPSGISFDRASNTVPVQSITWGRMKSKFERR